MDIHKKQELFIECAMRSIQSWLPQHDTKFETVKEIVANGFLVAHEFINQLPVELAQLRATEYSDKPMTAKEIYDKFATNSEDRQVPMWP